MNTNTTPVDLENEFDLTDKDMFELGMNAAENETKCVHLRGAIYFHGDSAKHDLSAFEGLELSDYNWSFIVENDEEVASIAYIVGVMRKYGFKYVGLYSSCWPAARDTDDGLGHTQIGDTFQLTVKFYPSKPGADKTPQYLFDIDDTNIEDITRAAFEENDINQARFDLLMRVNQFLSEKTANAVINAISQHGWRQKANYEDGMWVKLPYIVYTDSNDKEHKLDIYEKGVVLCDDDGYPIAVGPDAILQA